MTDSLHRVATPIGQLNTPTDSHTTYPPDGLTQQRTQLEMNPSSNASRAGGLKDFTVYVVIWPQFRIPDIYQPGVIKAGYTARDQRWKSWVRHHVGIPYSMTSFPTEKLARAYEATWLAMLDLISYRAFDSWHHAQDVFGRADGWTEMYHCPPDLNELARIMPAPFGGTPYWGPEGAFQIMQRHAHEAYLETRAAFDEALRSKRHRPVVVSSGEAS